MLHKVFVIIFVSILYQFPLLQPSHRSSAAIDLNAKAIYDDKSAIGLNATAIDI